MKFTVGIAVGIAVVAGLVLFFYASFLFPAVPSGEPVQQSELNLYANGTYGISFAFPSVYLVSEGERGTPQHPHYNIVLTNKKDADLPIAGEGPTTITIDVYPNTPNEKSLDAWLVANAESNLGLGSKETTVVTVDGEDAREYRWSGLYEGITTALLHDDSVILISVTYLTPEDAILTDYHALVGSVTLSK